MYPQSSDSALSAALPDVLVIAVSTVLVIAIAAWLAHDIARRAIDRANPDEVSAVVGALAAVLTTLGAYLPWSGPNGVITPPTSDSPAPSADCPPDPALPTEQHETQRQTH